MTKAAVKITAILAALILLVGAAFHMTGIVPVKMVLEDVEPEFYKNALAGMWVMPAVHWIFIAFLSAGLSWYKLKACAAILIAFGVWIITDALIVFLHVGPFMGVYMLGISGLLLLISGVLLRNAVKV